MLKNVMKIAAVGAFALTATATAANAGTTAQPGETAGLAMGAPLPEGVYFVNTLDWGVRKNKGMPDTKLLVDIPVIAWSTPWTLFGGNIQLLAATPMIHADLPGGFDPYGFYNPLLAAKIAFDLGGGFGVSYLSGIYFNAGDRDIRVPATTWRQDFAISYTGDGWNLTANLLWGITFGTSNYAAFNTTSNGFNLDLTATKTFGKWEIGAVGFGSTEYDRPDALKGTPKTKQFAVGPLVGYNFGPVILQAYLTRDVYARGTGGSNNRAKDTRFWSRIIIPLWTPATPAAPLVTKY
ncbi:transporter [Hansschlegelia zhihuaiae]|uniref:Transporter n=1 Tax=Hansschlegelia zhihuaiae TaxID=405005 RepID=A0A4Q0MLI9_9HYPH|nr:transporter [Hansschlegelia zhihuaiae]RXF74403.1 transporter [Hansschlegelia zhihuaiae]